MNFLTFISYSSYEELTIAISNIRYTYFNVSGSVAKEVEYKIKQGYNAGRIINYLRKNYSYQKEQNFMPLKTIIYEIMQNLKK